MGGVGGTSPVIWTRVSTDLQSSFRAATGFKVNMSIVSSYRAASSSANGDGSGGLIPVSVAGFGVAGCSAPFVASRKDDRRGGVCVPATSSGVPILV